MEDDLSRNSAVWLRAAACVTAAALVLAGCSKKENTSGPSGQGGNQESTVPETPDIQVVDGKPGGTFHLGTTEPTAIDSYNAQESEGSLVAHQLFTGLVQTDPKGKVSAGVAEKWSTDDSCNVWTFNLKKGTKFHNGEEVTSASFKRGWERAAAKAAASKVAYHMAQIKGYAEMTDGSATTMSGVDASDPYTLKVTLAEPSCEFYVRTVHPVFSPVPSTVGAVTDTKYTDEPIGNGPFKMDGPWIHDKGIKLKRFDDYTVGKKANLDAIEITITSPDHGNQDEYDGFKNKTFDWARMPTEVFPSARAEFDPKHEWIATKTSGINYLVVMVTEKPLDTAKARRALSMAIDRNAITQGVFKGFQTPATAIVPPSFKDAYQPDACDACKYDPEQAKKLAQEAGLTPGTALKFQFNTGAGHEAWTLATKDQLEKTLGLKVEYNGVPFKDLLKNQQQPHATGIFRLAWGADYPLQSNFLQPLFSTESIGETDLNKPSTGDNVGRYSNPKFDELIKKAAATKDEAERIKLYKEAEKLAVGTDQALIPMFQRFQFRLVNTEKFTNLRMNFFEDPDFPIISLK
jgi:oligopeptide transport system substrate-binding protein